MNGAQRISLALRAIPIWTVYLSGLLPLGWLVWQTVNGGLGVDPVKVLEHKFGEIALQLLIVGLAISPFLRATRINLVRFRRAIGLLAFLYVTLHLLVWLVLDVQIPQQIWSDIVKRPYVTIGMAGFVLMVPLALTSNNWSIRKLGPNWRRLHKLTYAICLLGGVHFIWLTKGWQLEPILYMATIVFLLLLRLPTNRARFGVFRSAL